MKGQTQLPKLYRELADWWPLLSAPEEYIEEAEWYCQAILSTSKRSVKTMLELGSGGGNNAFHLKKHFQMTLVDLSPSMLAVSEKLNSECEHVQGDMRSVRLNRQFDAVFVHDAITYMTSEDDLRSVIQTAFEHCAQGGVALFAPDETRETFRANTEHGGHDQGSRGMRYLSWAWDPDPSDTNYLYLMVYVLRSGDGQIRVVDDLHVCGLFAKRDWLRIMEEVGFQGSSLPLEHSEVGPGTVIVFLGIKPY